MAEGDSLVGGATDFENPDPIVEEGAEETEEVVASEEHTEEKPEGEVEKPDSEETEDKPDGAPEEYEDFKYEEGVDPLPEEVVSDLKEFAKELNLTQDQAQALADREVRAAKRADDSNLEVWQETQKEWQEAAKADKEYGGAKFNESVALAMNAISKFGTPEFAQVLNEYGFGNNPEVVRFFYRVGKAMSSDQMFTGKGGAGTPRDPASILYPNQN